MKPRASGAGLIWVPKLASLLFENAYEDPAPYRAQAVVVVVVVVTADAKNIVQRP